VKSPGEVTDDQLRSLHRVGDYYIVLTGIRHDAQLYTEYTAQTGRVVAKGVRGVRVGDTIAPRWSGVEARWALSTGPEDGMGAF
jgi:hypothetical protein